MDRTEIGRQHGTPYRLRYARMRDVGAYDSCLRRWFLEIDGEYVGDFRTKAEAMSEFQKENK